MSDKFRRGCLLSAALIACQAQAAVIGKAEIELGQMAAQKSQDKNVRKEGG